MLSHGMFRGFGKWKARALSENRTLTQVSEQFVDRACLSSIEGIIDDARNGRMFILVDDEERENEGDLVIPAQMATPEAVNFMAKFGRGLICLSLTCDRLRRLDLPLMAQRNASRHQTAFTVSIEAREGVTTGISASDRARTISVAIDPMKGREDIVCPGHIFPLEARDGGVLVRAGHTEAAVDVARLAGLNPSGVICEIMNDDGTMARLPDLIKFAQIHGLRIGTISDLISYRLRNDRIIDRMFETTFESHYGGEFRMYLYTNKVAYAEHIALVKGDIKTDRPLPVRMHALNVLEDILNDAGSDKSGQLHAAMQMIGDLEHGIVVLIREPHRTALSDHLRERMGQLNAPLQTVGSEEKVLRDYGVGAQILLDLGVRDMILLTNTPQRAIIGLEGYGLRIVDQKSIDGNARASGK